MPRNSFWTAQDAALTTSLDTWKYPDGVMSWGSTTSTLYDREGMVFDSMGTYEAMEFVKVDLSTSADYTFIATGTYQVTLSIYDSSGYLLRYTDGGDIGLPEPYPTDSIVDFVPDYSGTHYLSLSYQFTSSTGTWGIIGAEDVGRDGRNAGGTPTPPTTTPPTTTPPVGSGLNGTSSNDTLTGAAAADTLTGGLGNDVLSGFGGSDILYGNQGADTLDGGDGADTLFGGQDADAVSGAAGDDMLFGNMANDIISGGDGADSIFGGQGDDAISGGDGNDWLVGNLGNDTLNGGAGADTFAFRLGTGSDTVADFSAGSGDRIELLTGMDYTVMADVGGTKLQFDSGDSLTLVGIAPSSFSDAWIVRL